MTITGATYDEQPKHWNGVAGCAWVEEQELLDRMFQPLEDLLVDAVVAGSGHRVLDVGCGAGGITLAVARRLGPKGRCVGADISDPMIAAARTRAESEDACASFVRADIQTHPFEPADFDMIISRFGVMFFNDPVMAFANLRSAARDDAEMQFIAWRSAEENPFMTTAERAAAPLVPNIPVRQPDLPGQFGFADRHRVAAILDESGWADIDIRAIDVNCTLPEKDLVRYFTRLGPLGLVLGGVDDHTRSRVIETVRPAFDPYVDGDEVRYTAACWMVSARAGTQPKPGSTR
jgi:SAM-dependent methyltransferase